VGSDPLDVREVPAWITVRQWLTSQSLPLWAQACFDQDREVFAERLTLDGQPVCDAPRRLMVQSRQIYCYSTAEQNDWMTGADILVEKAARSMVRDYYKADGHPGWVKSVDSFGRVQDATRDFYAHSFVLFGLAAAFQSTKDDYYLVLADATLEFMDSMMAHDLGGYVACLPISPNFELTQNPHMHLLEALLALYEAAPRDDYRLRSEKIVELLEERLFQPATGLLGEYFTSKWIPVKGDRGCSFEPGHHFEWVWLLDRYSRLFNCSLPSCSNALFQTAKTHGFSKEGFLWAEVRYDGVVKDRSIRLWPHTEAIKAELSRSTGGRSVSADLLLNLIYKTFLEPAYPGGWHDRVTADGKLLTDCIPASSLYHIVCAFSEYERRTRISSPGHKSHRREP
jgi:mannose/cellobiose epimerase-like protein (N-acyl-D-glucosamine 2-epimerase family)